MTKGIVLKVLEPRCDSAMLKATLETMTMILCFYNIVATVPWFTFFFNVTTVRALSVVYVESVVFGGSHILGSRDLSIG